MKNTSLLNNKHLLVFIVLIQLISCSSSDAGSGTNTEKMPTNLIVIPEIVGQSALNPNGDGSGTVKLNINATNATSYVISYGDGNNQNATSGITTYTYKTIGTYSYQVNVTAYNGTNSISVPVSLKVYVSQIPIWADEFSNIDGVPDATKWTYDKGTGVGGWGNNELQFYTDRKENVKVQDGKLIITLKKESYEGKDYTSARLKTQGRFSFKYGKVEIKAKLPAGVGTWPALWMLGDNISTVNWPACGEIDIMEHVGRSQNVIHSTLHYPNNFGGNGPTKSTTITNASTEFHIYTLDWRADTIKFYVDGTLFHTFTNSSALPFNQNFFLIINCAMGGNFGGNTVDSNFTSSTFEVDYIRVFN